MKKFISMMLAIVMMMAISVPAFAAELNQNNPTGTATAVYQAGEVVDDNGTPDNPTDDTVQGTYIVTIPEYIVAAEKDGTPTEYDVTAKEVLIPYQTNLVVTVEYDVLELSGNNLPYQMKADPQSEAGALSDLASGATILTVAAGDPTAVTTSKIGAVLTEAPFFAGIYTDTVTFTVEVK